MSDEDIIKRLDRLEYQVSILGQAIDYDRFPIEALIMSMGWDRGDIDKVHDVFERWDSRLEKGESINHFEFEKDFEKAVGVTYQGLKSVLTAFWENHQWTNVCEAYVDSFDGSPAVEYHRIMRRER
jgi:hypothetical protein